LISHYSRALFQNFATNAPGCVYFRWQPFAFALCTPAFCTPRALTFIKEIGKLVRAAQGAWHQF